MENLFWTSSSELGILAAEGLVFPDQLFAGRASGVLGLDRAVDLSGLIIDGLTTTADSTCLDGNGTANPAETGGCIGDPTRKEYGAHGGVGLRKSEFVPIPTLPDHPSF